MDRFVQGMAGGAVCVVVLVVPARAFADDLFEIEVFHVRVNEPNQLGLELHSNYVVAGAARDPPEISPNHVLYELLEPTFGLLKGWEVGAHIQVAFRSGQVDWGGDRLRTMVVIPTPESLPFKFGVNLEGGYTPAAYNPNTWDIEFRPIAEWQISKALPGSGWGPTGEKGGSG